MSDMQVEIKHISGGTQIVGPHGTVNQYGSPADQLTAAVAALFEVVNRHRAGLAEPERVKAAALAVRAEAGAPHPRKDRLLALLREITIGAGGVGAVAGAAQGIAEIVQTLS
jgi:hypothetical protein